VILYHGTSYERWQSVWRKGLIRPRGKNRGNWDGDVRSHPRVIYLTDAYPLFFAGNASGGNEGERDEGDLVVLEIDVTGLEGRLVPDEDVLAQVDQHAGRLDPGERLSQRTVRYRRLLSRYRSRENAELSLKLMGTCGVMCDKHFPGIDVGRVKRVAQVRPETYGKLVLWGHDPVICISNYKIMAERHRAVTRWLFDPSDKRLAPCAEGVLDTGSVSMLGGSALHQALMSLGARSCLLPPAELRAGIAVQTSPCTGENPRDKVAPDRAADTASDTERGA
jgi:hypothetical protein